MDTALPRKLAAILYADVAEYSRLTEEYEETTHRYLSEYLDLISESVDNHRGRVMHFAGDAVLAMFEAALDAVSCAVEVQSKLAGRNSGVSVQQRLQFRIGVNLGDVIEDRGDIYGDGVNVAARLESLASPGGICISDAVKTAIKTKLNLQFDSLGEQKVKNIDEPVRAYRVIIDDGSNGERKKLSGIGKPNWAKPVAILLAVVSISAALLVWMNRNTFPEPDDYCTVTKEFELPDRPSLAVLPFVNQSADSSQQYLSNVIGESITTTLAKVPDLFVIAHDSSAVFTDQTVNLKDVASDLGVRYLMKGSVQQIDDRMRVSTQLIDSETGQHVWTERYDRDARESFEMIDEISFKILNALEVKLTTGEQARIRGKGTDNLEAYQYYLQSGKEQLRLSPEGNANALEFAKKATELDPEFWGGWIALGYASSTRYWYGTASKEESLNSGLDYVQKAFKYGGESNPDAYLLSSFVENWRGNEDRSVELARKAIELSPNMSDAWAMLGLVFNSSGNPEKAVPAIENAMRLSPYNTSWLPYQLAKAYRHTERHERAVQTYQELICHSPDSTVAYRDLAISYGTLGEKEKARAAVSELLRIQPGYSLQEYISEGDSGVDPTVRDRNIDILRSAGLPE